MFKKSVKIDGGKVDYGRGYEQKIAAYLAIKSALDPDVSDFWIVSNVPDVDAFDDIILMVQDYDGNKKLYCIQLKHIENKTLQAHQLEGETGRYSLGKYQKSFNVIENNIITNSSDILRDLNMDQIYLILWTNAKLTGQEKLKNIKMESKGGMTFLNTSTDSNIYKINNLPSSKKPFSEKYFERFYLFVNQVSAVYIDKLIKDLLFSHFSNIDNSIIIAITDYFAKWSLGDKRVIERITKADVQNMMLEFFLLPHLIEPTESVQMYPEKIDLINDTLTSFNVIPITTNVLKTIFTCNMFLLNKFSNSCLDLNSWNSDLPRNQSEALKATADKDSNSKSILKILEKKKLYVPYLTIKDVFLAAWQCRLVPWIVRCNESGLVEEILIKFKNVTQNMSFVLLNSSNSIFENNLKLFDNINSLEDGHLKARNLEQSFISLQGKKKIALKSYEHNIEVLRGISPDVYLMLMQDVVQVGKTIEIENYYVQRDLHKPRLKLSVLDENSNVKNQEHMLNNKGDIFVLVEYDGKLPLRYQGRCANLIRYLKEESYKEEEKTYILLTDFSDTDELVVRSVPFLQSETSKSVHVLKLKGNYLEWLFSKGTVESLQHHIIETALLKEDNPEYNIPEDYILNKSKSDVNIISNNAGMGKTCMLKSIANKFEPDEWIFYINLSENIRHIPEENKFASFFKHVTATILKDNDKCLKDLISSIYIQCLLENKLIFLFDGYDEVASNHVLTFLKEAKENNLKMWITTRPTYKNVLEMQMENLSFEITHFSTQDHVTFLWKYFYSQRHIYQYDTDQIQYIIDSINKCSSTLDKTFIAVPLQTRMFAEIFGDDINDISEKEKFTIAQLYNKFVDVKLKEYKSYEATSLRKTLSKLALKLFFVENQLEDIIDFRDLTEEAIAFQESYKKDSIVIGLNEQGDAVFGHRTFAEFLAAWWLAKQVVNRKGEYNIHLVPILEKLYYIEMLPVRMFFDKILSQDLPLHTAVLNNDIESVRTLLTSEQSKETVDILGRSALHIAVTYGNYYDLYIAREVKGLRNVGLHSTIRKFGKDYQFRIPSVEDKQYGISREVLEELLSKDFENNTDKLLRYDLFDYAMKSCSLNFVHCLFNKFEKESLRLEFGFSFEIFLVYITRDNLHNILSKQKCFNFDSVEENEDQLRDMFKDSNFSLLKVKYNDLYLSELAAINGGIETVFVLFRCGALGMQDGSIVHKACALGQTKVLETLYKIGGNIEKPDESGWSPIYQAGLQKREDIIYQFLKGNSAMLKSRNTSQMTPVHYAAQFGHVETMKKLIELGARVNVLDTFDNTPLLYACIYGYHDIVELLLKSGHIDISDKIVKSAINVAAFHGYSDCVKTLLEFGLDANNTDKDGNTPLVISSRKGFSNVIFELASHENCNLNLMVYNESMSSIQMRYAALTNALLHTKLFHIKCDRKKIGGVTALHFAAMQGHADCVKTLLDFGAEGHIEDEIMNYPPLVWSSMFGCDKVIKIFLSSETNEEDTMKRRNAAELGMIWATIIGHEKIVEILIKYLADTEPQHVENEATTNKIKAVVSAEFGVDQMNLLETDNLPLLIAAKNGHTDVVRTLILNNGKYGLEEALYWAAKSGHVDCVRLLISFGADENKTTDKRKTRVCILPIAWASMYNSIDVVTFLLSNKTKEYLKNKNLHAALNWAAVGGHYQLVKLLLDFGLDVNNVDEELDGTPLICACVYRGTTEVIDALMEKGCKVDIKNSEGLSALDIAAEKKNFEFVKRFISCGIYKQSDITKGSKTYKNLQLALNWALEKEHYSLVEELVSLGIAQEK